MPRSVAAPIARVRAVDIANDVLTADVISHGPNKIEVEGIYARVFPAWGSEDGQKLPESVLVPIAAIPSMVEKLLEVLGHRPVWPEKH